jgi:hypothetical protein
MKHNISNNSGAWIGIWTAIGAAFRWQKPKNKKYK